MVSQPPMAALGLLWVDSLFDTFKDLDKATLLDMFSLV